MTRTERAAYPRAVNKDRSESRSGLDTSLRKSGAGQHNWGSLADERRIETDAARDEAEERASSPEADDAKPSLSRTSSISDEELEKARKYRKNALKKGAVDLTQIARTSAAVSGSPPSPVSATSLARRLSRENTKSV
ncbi:hypothetical protein CPB83DRAFT_849275 [Crepidotus variabilis]|uniref:Hyaluronan/mRNA-binding protein domain-containing protein n=1 Tax=Crepidotus variabilis TaxID=179855 RepID=A0A9P6ELN1_9AGAR|nr:hypothetical protein CPB83DRAFT_849275 [Crepidotus variabilis]